MLDVNNSNATAPEWASCLMCHHRTCIAKGIYGRFKTVKDHDYLCIAIKPPRAGLQSNQ